MQNSAEGNNFSLLFFLHHMLIATLGNLQQAHHQNAMQHQGNNYPVLNKQHQVECPPEQSALHA
jgi:hypothetical protein